MDLKDTISGFKGVLEGKYDDLPEMAFYMVGDINEVIQKADRMAAELGEEPGVMRTVGGPETVLSWGGLWLLWVLTECGERIERRSA